MTMTTSEAGRLGAIALYKKLTKKQRSEKARKAVQARWKNHKKKV